MMSAPRLGGVRDSAMTQMKNRCEVLIRADEAGGVTKPGVASSSLRVRQKKSPEHRTGFLERHVSTPLCNSLDIAKTQGALARAGWHAVQATPAGGNGKGQRATGIPSTNLPVTAPTSSVHDT